MIHQYALVSCLCVLALLFSGCSDKADTPISIGFYNCENFFHPSDHPQYDDDAFTPNGSYHYNRAMYEQKLHHMAIALQSMFDNDTLPQMAMMGLAEIEDTVVLRDLVMQPELARLKLRYVWLRGADKRGIHNALLYNPSFFSTVHAENLQVNYLGNTGDTVVSRSILSVMGILKGDTTHVLVNHWPSQRNGNGLNGHAEALSVISHKINDLHQRHGSNHLVLLMGDFNENPTDPQLAELQSKWFYNPFATLHTTTSGTECYDGKWNLFDQILLSANTSYAPTYGWKLNRALIYNPPFLQNPYQGSAGEPYRFFNYSSKKGFSDHFPVLVTLQHISTLK